MLSYGPDVFSCRTGTRIKTFQNEADSPKSLRPSKASARTNGPVVQPGMPKPFGVLG